MGREEFRWNPFKPKVIQVAGEVSPNTFEERQPMPWGDAAKIALIVTLAEVFLAFLVLYSYADICANPGEFLYRLIVFAGGTFFTTFGMLAGISRYYAGKKNPGPS